MVFLRPPTGRGAHETMDQTVFSMDHAVAILARTPSTVRALLEGLPEGWVRSPT